MNHVDDESLYEADEVVVVVVSGVKPLGDVYDVGAVVKLTSVSVFLSAVLLPVALY